MSANDRVQDLQTALNERGVVDCKFYIRRKANTTDEHVFEDAKHLLESFIRGDMVDHAPIGDSATAK